MARSRRRASRIERREPSPPTPIRPPSNAFDRRQAPPCKGRSRPCARVSFACRILTNSRSRSKASSRSARIPSTASATILIPALHLRIFDATVHEKNGSRWIGLPAKPQVTKEGVVRKDDRGKTAYSPVLEFTDRATRDAFSQRVIERLLERHPDAFAGEAVA